MDRARWLNVVESRRRYEEGVREAAPGPLEAFFEVAARCNLHCRMCAINYDTRYLPGSRRPPFLTPELFSRLEPIFPTLLRAYLFGLGEPILNRHLVDFVQRLSSAGVEVWFNTNATLIDEEKAEALARAGATSITVSIDGATAETYERIRVGARFSDCLRGIRALVAASRRHGNPAVDLSFVAMASNLHELPGLIDFAAHSGVRGVHVEPLYSQIQHDLQEHYARENLAQLGARQVDDHFQRARERAERQGVRLASRFLLDGGSADYVERARSFRNWWTCSEPWSSIWVTSAGEVRTCCINETSFGSLFEHEFAEIWNGAAFSAFRRAHAERRETPTGCANCIRNGRPRHSPFYAPLEAVTYRPIATPGEAHRAGTGAAIEWPRENAVVTDPIVVTGAVPVGTRGEIVIDRAFPLPLGSVAVVEGGKFIAVLDLPFVTEGSHLVGLRATPGGEIEAERTVHLWRPPAGEGETRASGIAARLLTLTGPPVRPKIRAVEFGRLEGTWLAERSENRWKVAVTFDVSGLSAGTHSIDARPRWQAYRFQVLRLPDTAPGLAGP